MPRARNIKPALFKNELLGTADPFLTLLFEGLWCLADREGRLEDRPLRIKAETFPYREKLDVNGYLTDLERLGFIHRYEVDNIAIIQVIEFLKHQRPHKTEKQSELPEKPKNSSSQKITFKDTLKDGQCTCKNALIPDTGSPIKNKGTSAKSGKFKPPDWIPFDKWGAYLKSRRAMKKHPMNDESIALVIPAIEKTMKAGHSLDEVMDALIANGWRTIKPSYLTGKQESATGETESERIARLQAEINAGDFT